MNKFNYLFLILSQLITPVNAHNLLTGAYFKSACYATQISFGDNPLRWIVTMHVTVQPCEFKKFKIVRHWQPGRHCVTLSFFVICLSASSII